MSQILSVPASLFKGLPSGSEYIGKIHLHTYRASGHRAYGVEPYKCHRGQWYHFRTDNENSYGMWRECDSPLKSDNLFLIDWSL